MALGSRALLPHDFPESGYFTAVLCNSRCDTLETDTQDGALHSRSEEHTSELQSRGHLVCRLLLEKKNEITYGKSQPQLLHRNLHSNTALEGPCRSSHLQTHGPVPSPRCPVPQCCQSWAMPPFPPR